MAKRTTKRVVKKTARRKVAARAAATRKSRARVAPQKPSAMSSTATTIKGALAGAVASVTGRRGAADALALLEADHRRIEALFKRGEKTTARGVKVRSEVLRSIESELNAHELIEEKILYPALEVHPEAHDIVLEGVQEHHVADLIMKELRALDRADEQWGAKFKVLKENIEHHIQEEEGPMFRTARGVFSRDELRAMGGRMSKMKAQAS